MPIFQSTLSVNLLFNILFIKKERKKNTADDGQTTARILVLNF